MKATVSSSLDFERKGLFDRTYRNKLCMRHRFGKSDSITRFFRAHVLSANLSQILSKILKKIFSHGGQICYVA